MKKNIIIYTVLILSLTSYCYLNHHFSLDLIIRIILLFILPVFLLILYETTGSKMMLALALIDFFSTISFYLFHAGIYPLALIFIIFDLFSVFLIIKSVINQIHNIIK